MREILFKAKRIDTGEWVEGVPVDVTPLTCISSDKVKPEVLLVRGGFADWGMPRGVQGCKVDPSTVCQYTGITDKNGKKIFEGDIIKIEDSKRPGLPAPVMFLQDQCQFVVHRSGYNPIWLNEVDPQKDLVVIGNVHDN